MAIGRLVKVQCIWTSPAIRGGGTTTWFFDEAASGAPDVAGLKANLEGVKFLFPSGTTITVPNQGDSISAANGSIVGSWGATGGGTVTGTGTGGSAAGVGACASWYSDTIVGRRRLRGRTFLVPLVSSNYDTDGTLTTSAMTSLNGWAAAMLARPGFALWHRPTSPGGTDGAAGLVARQQVRDKVAMLKSRRD